MHFTTAITAAVLAFTSGASAHMRLANPIPFSGDTSSPLEPDGSNFPCKGSAYTVATMNDWEAGSTQAVSFIGSAVHGGGSCQFSFTTDKAPTKDSEWKVIHSVIGGCPKAGVDGNLAENAEGTDADKFPITIPKDIPNGQLTFAWTWFNKIGNREMYMECAPVTISGGSDSADLGSLPDMFTANISPACTTAEGTDVNFPNPGASVEDLGQAAQRGAPGFTGAGCQAAGVSTPVTTPTEGDAAPPADPVSSAPAAPISSAPAAALPVAPVASAPAAALPADPVSAPATGGSTCTTEGTLVCIDSTHFAICANGSAVSQAVATGTTCADGKIMRRAVRHPRRHGSSMVRRHGSVFKA